jgi:hypothetical protein
MKAHPMSPHPALNRRETIMIYQILNAGEIADRAEYKRCWLEPGEPMIIGPSCLIELRINTQDDNPEPMLRLETFHGDAFEAPLPAGCQLDARPYAKVFIVPRAAELDEQGVTRRALVEFVRLDITQPLAV